MNYHNSCGGGGGGGRGNGGRCHDGERHVIAMILL
jgi:hypothetical protein